MVDGLERARPFLPLFACVEPAGEKDAFRKWPRLVLGRGVVQHHIVNQQFSPRIDIELNVVNPFILGDRSPGSIGPPQPVTRKLWI